MEINAKDKAGKDRENALAALYSWVIILAVLLFGAGCTTGVRLCIDGTPITTIDSRQGHNAVTVEESRAKHKY